MNTTDIVAWVGAITGSLGTILGMTALVWDYYKWKRQSRPELTIQALPTNKLHFPGVEGQYHLLGMTGPDDKFVRVSVINRGSVKTTIQILGLAFFEREPNRKFNKPIPERFFVGNQMFEPLPKILEPGEQWNGIINQNNDIEDMAKRGYLYALVEHTLGPTVYSRIKIE